MRLRTLGWGNVLIAGDAAGATNPIFGGGIHAALSIGRMAAQRPSSSRRRMGKGGPAAPYQARVMGSPFFRPVLSAIAALLADTTDVEFVLAVRVFRRRRRMGALLRLLPLLLLRPRLVRKTLRLPWLREALEVTVRYGW